MNPFFQAFVYGILFAVSIFSIVQDARGMDPGYLPPVASIPLEVLTALFAALMLAGLVVSYDYRPRPQQSPLPQRGRVGVGAKKR